MATAEAPAQVSRGQWLVLTDQDELPLYYVVSNVLKRGTEIKCKARVGPCTLTPAAHREPRPCARRE